MALRFRHGSLCLAAVFLMSCGESRVDSPTRDPAIREAAPRERDTQNFAGILRDVVQIPASSKGKPFARINLLTHAGDGSVRMFVNDMRGRIYIVKNDELVPQPVLDMAAIRGPAFLGPATGELELGLSSFAFHPDFAKTGRPGFRKMYTTSTESSDSGIADLPRPQRAASAYANDGQELLGLARKYQQKFASVVDQTLFARARNLPCVWMQQNSR